MVFAICTTGATVQKQLFLFAPMVQGPNSSFFCLHRWCKRSKVVFEVCTAGASISKSTLAATARYQRHSSGIRESILSSNSRYYKGTCAYIHISLSAMHAPPNSKNAGLQNVLPEECAEIHSHRFMRLKKYSVVRGFALLRSQNHSVVRGLTPVRRYLPRKMECINGWNEKKQSRKGSAGVSGDDILRR